MTDNLKPTQENTCSPKPATILIVDDTEANVDILVELLGNEYDIMVAMDGISALEIALQEKPDLILLDVMMPDMDGWEVCRRLKADNALKDIPVIFVTAKIEVTDETRGLAIGAVDYITKPISPSAVMIRVKTQLEQVNMKARGPGVAPH